MKRILNYNGIPNVVTHYLTDKVINEMSLYFGKIVTTRKFIPEKRCFQNKEANVYLARQFKRLIQYAKNDELEKFNFLAKKLLRSYSFQLQAYQSVYPKMDTLKWSTNASHLRYLRKLCYKLETDIDMKRVWIDKKPGDYGRPLGVPTIVWRVYLRMLTNIGECFAEGKGLYSDFQHGGRPGKGVMTCLMEMVERFKDCDRIYEFDIKGFFDHIKKDTVKEFFKGTILAELYFQLLQSKPKSYTLPPKDKDPAVKLYEEKPVAPKEITVVRRRRVEVQWWNPEGDDWMEVSDITEIQIRTLPEIPSVPETIEEKYAELMENIKTPTKIRDTATDNPFAWWRPESYEELNRAQARDNWKDLNLPEQGIPQGSSFGPFLASTIGAYYLRGIKNLLMYIDDGMIFVKKGTEPDINRLKVQLKRIGLELAPEKTRMLNKEELITKGVKFLGTRTRKYSTMASETRKGIIKSLGNFKEYGTDQYLTILEMLYERGMLTHSKNNQLRHYLTYERSRLKEFLNDEGLHIAIKFGFFGNLLAEAYSPAVTPDDMKAKIREGMDQAGVRYSNSKHSQAGVIMRSPVWKYKGLEGDEEVVPTIFNITTLAINVLLEGGIDLLGIKGVASKRSEERIRNLRKLETDAERVTYIGLEESYKYNSKERKALLKDPKEGIRNYIGNYDPTYYVNKNILRRVRKLLKDADAE